MSSLTTYALKAVEGRLLACFTALTLEEAQQRAQMVARTLGSNDDWRLIVTTDTPVNVPRFEEEFFLALAQAHNRLN